MEHNWFSSFKEYEQMKKLGESFISTTNANLNNLGFNNYLSMREIGHNFLNLNHKLGTILYEANNLMENRVTDQILLHDLLQQIENSTRLSEQLRRISFVQYEFLKLQSLNPNPSPAEIFRYIYNIPLINTITDVTTTSPSSYSGVSSHSPSPVMSHSLPMITHNSTPPLSPTPSLTVITNISTPTLSPTPPLSPLSSPTLTSSQLLNVIDSPLRLDIPIIAPQPSVPVTASQLLDLISPTDTNSTLASPLVHKINNTCLSNTLNKQKLQNFPSFKL